MTYDQIVLFSLMGGVLALLVWGRYRYDLVAFGALALGLLLGVIPKDEAFSGFGHSAVIIVALVLIASKGLSQSGAINLIADKFLSTSQKMSFHIGAIGLLGGVLSAFMNNVAALALLMPVDIQAAQRSKRSPALTLMPLSFATILGGMVTLIGTPPNIVIAQFREDALGAPYAMFDFAPVGFLTALIGLIFVSFVGWRMIPIEPTKHNAGSELENIDDYIVELTISDGSPIIGTSPLELAPEAEEADAIILGVIRRGERLPGRAANVILRKGDVLVVEAIPSAIEQIASAMKLTYSSAAKHSGITAKTLSMVEVVVPIGARIEKRSAMDLRLLYRHGVMLLGISREGKRFHQRVRRLKIKAGDMVLLMGSEDQLPDVINWLGCYPLAGRNTSVTQHDKAKISISIFAAAIIAASFGLVYLPVALAACVVLYVLFNVISLSQIYDSVEWPVIVLLASLIPIGAALEKSGGTALIAEGIIDISSGWPIMAILAFLMVVTMSLSNVLNNVATALIAAPVAVDMAKQLHVSPDAMLMGVAVAASCAFMTPIGHKNNTIIMGPGGYRFGDYWRMGLALQILVLVVSLPLIAVFWPL